MAKAKKEDNALVLIGTYKGNQLEKWPNYYNYPISDADKITDVDAKRIDELWLFKGVCAQKTFSAKFVGIKTREELVKNYAYPAIGKAHSNQYLLFKITPIEYPRVEDKKVILRTKDFASSKKLQAQLKAYLESDARGVPEIAAKLPEVVRSIPKGNLCVCESAIQLDFFNALFKDSSISSVVKKEVLSCKVQAGSATSRRKFKVASLFSGCGGLDLGFLGGFTFSNRKYSKTDFDIVFANDIDPDATTCYKSNKLLSHGEDVCVLGDIRDLPLEQIPDFDVLLAGFPCQPFSNAGNRKGVHDNNGRGTLFEMCQAVLEHKIVNSLKENQPKAFVFENVKGILSSKMPDGESVPNEIKKRMNRLGFSVSINLVCASDYGVPQKRQRVLIVGVRNDIAGEIDFASVMENVVSEYNIPSRRRRTFEPLLLGSILQNLPVDEEDSKHWVYSKTTQEMVDKIGPCIAGAQDLKLFKKGFSIEALPSHCFVGKSWKDVPRDLLTPRFQKIYDNPKRYHSPKFFRRFALGEINGTLTASAQPENCGITHPFENRRFTVRESARIQSFPDKYRFDSISLQSRYKVIGNAVPPILGWVIANALRIVLERGLTD